MKNQIAENKTVAVSQHEIKGYVMNDERLKQPEYYFGKDYFEEQLEQIRDIRSSEQRFYQKITDIYSKCSAQQRKSHSRNEFASQISHIKFSNGSFVVGGFDNLSADQPAVWQDRQRLNHRSFAVLEWSDSGTASDKTAFEIGALSKRYFWFSLSIFSLKFLNSVANHIHRKNKAFFFASLEMRKISVLFRSSSPGFLRP